VDEGVAVVKAADEEGEGEVEVGAAEAGSRRV